MLRGEGGGGKIDGSKEQEKKKEKRMGTWGEDAVPGVHFSIRKKVNRAYTVTHTKSEW